MTTSSSLIIGIAGSFASGKDTVAHRLVEDFGFSHVSTGDLVREVAQRERGSIERPILREVADYHRHHDGAGAFIRMAFKRTPPLVITGIRALGEAKAIKEHGGVLLFIDAPAEVRYERMKARHRDAEVDLTLAEFEANEAKEWHSGNDDSDFNLRDIKAMADFVVDNDLPLEQCILHTYRLLGLPVDTQ